MLRVFTQICNFCIMVCLKSDEMVVPSGISGGRTGMQRCSGLHWLRWKAQGMLWWTYVATVLSGAAVQAPSCFSPLNPSLKRNRFSKRLPVTHVLQTAPQLGLRSELGLRLLRIWRPASSSPLSSNWRSPQLLPSCGFCRGDRASTNCNGRIAERHLRQLVELKHANPQIFWNFFSFSMFASTKNNLLNFKNAFGERRKRRFPLRVAVQFLAPRARNARGTADASARWKSKENN